MQHPRGMLARLPLPTAQRKLSSNPLCDAATRPGVRPPTSPVGTYQHGWPPRQIGYLSRTGPINPGGSATKTSIAAPSQTAVNAFALTPTSRASARRRAIAPLPYNPHRCRASTPNASSSPAPVTRPPLSPPSSRPSAPSPSSSPPLPSPRPRPTPRSTPPSPASTPSTGSSSPAPTPSKPSPNAPAP